MDNYDLPENNPNYKGKIGAIGFGLNQKQQEAITDLWKWQERSLRSKIVLGGPVNGLGLEDCSDISGQAA